ncbi:MAG: hypothetical protein ACFFD2_08830 [Promethearchaeota archaeon]
MSVYSFVFSFGTIEFVDGILIIDANLKYKTFEKEYTEILKQCDKSIKKILKQAFSKGEFTVKDSKLEIDLLNTLKKLEKYDKPSFKFIESFPPSQKEHKLQEMINTSIEEKNFQGEPEILEEPPIFTDTPQLDKVIPQKPTFLDNITPKIQKNPVDTQLKDELSLSGLIDIQEALSSMKIETILEEPTVIDDSMEKISISEVKAQSKRIISNFIVQITEQANFKLDHNNKIVKSEIIGKIFLKNTGKQDKIWDINLKLDNIKSTSLKNNFFYINELGPGNIWKKEYQIEKQKELPIKFKECIDTFTINSEEIHTLIPNKKNVVEFTYILENQDNQEIINLRMEKEIPKKFTNLKLIDKVPASTELKVQDHVITWLIPKIQPNQTLNLKIQATITPNTLNSVKTGPIQINFTKLNDFYSGTLLEDISSISKNMYYIEKDEREKFPDQWNCRLILENKSEFPFLLENAEVFSGDIKSEEKATVFRAINKIIQPDNEWISEKWNTISEDIPTFGKKLKFKIIPTTKKSFTAKIEIDEIELPILWVEVKKSYSLSELASYINTAVDVVCSIINKGNAEISEFTMKDFIPEDFIPPSTNNIKVLIDGAEINNQKQKIDLNIEKIPDSDESNQPHQIILQLLNLQTTIGAVKKNSKIEVQYSMTAIKPPPEKVYTFPVVITCKTNPTGPQLEITPDIIDNSEITVTHQRRKLTIGKSIVPGSVAGEYIIEMVFKNRGNTPIENAIISDLVPANFTILSSEPEATTNKFETETVLEWKFDVIEPGKKVEILYKIKGTGKYKISDAEIFYKV